jgi:hypothetical protein
MMKEHDDCGCGCGRGGCGDPAGSPCGQGHSCHDQVMEFLDCTTCGQRFNKQLGQCPQCEGLAEEKGK